MSDDIAAFAIATGSTTIEAAKKASVKPRTVDRWLATPGFRERISEIRSEILSRSTGKLVNILTCSIDTLRALLDSASHTVRLGAARTILDTAVKYHETLVLEERIRKLEAGEQPSIENQEAGAGQVAVDHSTEEDGPPADSIQTTA